jgi:hypothetical protein
LNGGLLSELPQETYPAGHELVVYEAATLPVTQAKVQRLSPGAAHRGGAALD